jgi:hypothetical protein
MVGAQCVQREREARQKAWELDHLGSGLPHRCHWGSCNACGCHSASPLATVLIAELVEPTLLRSSAESNDSTARSVSGGSSSSHAVASTLCAVVDATAWLELLELELLELNIVRARSLGSLLATFQRVPAGGVGGLDFGLCCNFARWAAPRPRQPCVLALTDELRPGLC